ncbi:sigma-70 family RNA polymerase sigma factor [Synechococcus sp. CS-602]|uniref:sigma-70 family RNA polymerase sigma factor n=1 Tax=Synechococcaceae TaxID=1890426 RepID=UPI0008FF619C|nr:MULTISPECIES: sigma-70 family RNA polymerase sigma factor [Synechococcaceae]MCT4365459.1 sigma-70 family RNA polymerase sigma factor [Candidatus Regnicoccus frigidus MAG-AL1]APD47509.1 hypothetical protein BM449_03445 [Synechococcus sp. SynAce01]MCT0202525.1 sigma-70 family RNA polymerase sigma factor [Synechococcus sp. CS-603]MCT0204329.1 sigma-70 family RNA polymerase sigma factor [Synechococcus sp. CS-602]MCT0247171.1 sigma-70 family RNA polymerase sigma factor [Synechococcus sp. CS-601]
MPETTYASLNPTLLGRYHRSADQHERNRLVELNLPLVRKVADRQSRSTNLPFDDLLQLGCLGLIKAIESFDPGKGVALSSYAVPYIRGAMQHHLRDQHPPLRCSRLLRELHRRGQTLQQQCLHQQLPALDGKALAAALGCQPERWQEACALHWALQLRSLDAPVGHGEESSLALVDLLEAPQTPHPCRPDSPAESPCCEPEPQDWLRLRLGRLDPDLRQLLEGRVLAGASWRELGEALGLKARVAQKRFETLVAQLRLELGAELGELFSPQDELQSAAARIVPG